MNLDLSPRPGAARRGVRVASHARTEARLLLRNGEQILLALVIPVALLVAGMVFGDRFGIDRATFPASVMALAVWSSAFTALAINTAFERRYGVLERLVATPLTRGDLIAGKALATAAITAGQLLVLAVAALALGWRPAGAFVPVVVAVAAVVLASVVFACLGLALAGRLEATYVLGLANLVYLAGAAGTALLLPLASYPAAIRPLLAALPTSALGEAMRAAASGQAAWWPLGVLALWAIGSVALAQKVFRWIS